MNRIGGPSRLSTSKVSAPLLFLSYICLNPGISAGNDSHLEPVSLHIKALRALDVRVIFGILPHCSCVLLRKDRLEVQRHCGAEGDRYTSSG